jgi:GT2 family glycosyltransferase
VLVDDNDSAEGCEEMLAREFPLAMLNANCENVGFARANNQALQHCRGRYVLLLNPDTEIVGDAVGTMVRYLEANCHVGALGCRLLNSDGSYQRWTAGAFPDIRRVAAHAFFLDTLFTRVSSFQSLFLRRDVDQDLDVDWVSGACLLLRREALGSRIFDESFFMYGEDTDLCLRLKRSGWRVVYSPSATVVHHHGRSMARQTGDILLTSLKGPRAFYVAHHGRRFLWLYDVLIALTFLTRAALYGTASIASAGRYRRQTASSWNYFRRAILVMRGR